MSARPAAGSPWVNRIVDHGKIAVDEVLFNPRNFRVHPKAQKEALRGAISADMGLAPRLEGAPAEDAEEPVAQEAAG